MTTSTGCPASIGPSPRRRQIPVVVVVGLVLTGACRDAAPPPAAPEHDAALRSALGRVRQALVVDVGAMEATALNLGSAQDALARLRRNFDALRVRARIPDEPQIETLHAQIVAHASRVGLTASDVTIEARAASPRPVPDTISGPTRYHYTADQIRGVLDVHLTLAPIDLDRLERWLRTLPSGMDRMLRVRRIVPHRQGFTVQAEAYWWRDPGFPRHEATHRTLQDYLAAAGVDTPSDVVAQQAPARLWRRIVELASRLDDLRPKATRTLTTYAEANLEEARWDFFERTAHTIEKTRLMDVLE